MTTDDGLVIRRASPADRAAIIDLLAVSLGRDADPRYETLFAWKHDTNPVGASPAWVATDGERLAGFRVLMQWEFSQGDRIVHAVRAVDTATHPDYQGRGIFTRLTLHAIDELRDEGVDFVFNTPNDQSRPGYLKMGWQVVGQLPTVVRPTHWRRLPRVLTARVPAERWSTPTEAGEPAAVVLADTPGLERLIAGMPAARGTATHRTAAYLRWRYGTPLLGYRAVVARGGLGEGVALFRVRARGAAREVALCDLLVAGGDRGVEAALVREVARVDADYVIALGGRAIQPGPMFRLPRQGPLLTWRAVAETTIPDRWDLALGDIELF